VAFNIGVSRERATLGGKMQDIPPERGKGILHDGETEGPR
jgi:hypothetical protein